MPSMFFRLPWYREVRKYQRRSRWIGPPTDPFTSQILMRLAGLRRPRSRSSWVKLLLCSESQAPVENSDPLIVLPPVRGTTLMIGPPTSASPLPPDVVKLISWAFPMSQTQYDLPA